jgi:hypothetical protein
MTRASEIAIAPADPAYKQELFVYPALLIYGLSDGGCMRKIARAILHEEIAAWSHQLRRLVLFADVALQSQKRERLSLS